MGSSNSKSRPTSTKNDSHLNSDNISPSVSFDDEIYRLAIHQSAKIGSFYDARTDNLIQELSLTCEDTRKNDEDLKDGLICEIIKRDEFESKLIHENKINMDENFQLNLTLDIIQESSLSTLINRLFQTDSYTHILYYRYIGEEKYLKNDDNLLMTKNSEMLKNMNINATHFISSIKTGILVIVTFTLLPNDEPHLNSILNKIKEQLKKNVFDLAPRDEKLVERLESIQMFSNIPDLRELSRLHTICKKIVDIESSASNHRLLEYGMRPFSKILSSEIGSNHKYIPLTSASINKIKQYLNELSSLIASLTIDFTSEEKKLLKTHLKDQLELFKQQKTSMREKHQRKVRNIRKIVVNIRSGESKDESLFENKMDEDLKSFAEDIQSVKEEYTVLHEKIQFIEEMKKTNIKYWNIKNRVKDNDYDLQKVIEELQGQTGRTYMYCFDDRLEKPKSEKWNEFYKKMLDGQKGNPEFEHAYTDFTYCQCQLKKMKVLKSKNIREQKSTREDESTSPQSTHPRTTKKIVNVLFLGESGVGKSTFINALVNYLRYETIHQAKRRPLSVMPVSFIVTEGEHFEERTVTFGKPDDNEIHNKLGQSVTQQCKSYIFPVSTRTDMRLIDTPGMGDTRGLEQDDRNMESILSFISKLSHLNAICILLKPNEAKLNVVLRSYFNRLLGFLGKNVSKNIVFCFTNTRGTFFAPGDTGPLLKKLIESYSTENIRFTKQNTFCFDNESFRYLIVQLNRIQFDDFQTKEYEQSWTVSVNESNRFLTYICSEIEPYYQKEWQSIEHATFQIKQLFRPMMETMRTHLRNLIICESEQSLRMIEFHPKIVSQPSTICLECKVLDDYCGFGILLDVLHILSEKCDCGHDRAQHIDVSYRLEYHLSWNKNKSNVNEIKQKLERLQKMILQLQSYCTHQDDSFLSFLNYMIQQEKYICEESTQTNDFNSKLLKNLKTFIKELKHCSLSSKENADNLEEIYQNIEAVFQIDEIKKQMDIIQQQQQEFLFKQEIRLN